jgi:pimeloyl-ACP methyl ester carboxylesterase
MRASQPAIADTVHRDGFEIYYERYGDRGPAIVLLPTWSLVHSRHWKMQIPYLARHFRVLCFDGRGSGGSARPADPEAYSDAVFAADAVEVMDAAGIETATLVSVSCGALWALRLAAEHAHRVSGLVFVAPTAPLVPGLPERRVQRFRQVFEAPAGWQKYNARYWRTDYPDFVDFFVGRIFTEPHSTKQVEDAIDWALETDGEALEAADRGLRGCNARSTRRLATQVACPVLVVHGTQDAVRGHAEGRALAKCTGGALVSLDGAGHFPHLRDPVRVNLLIKQFVDRIGQ